MKMAGLFEPEPRQWGLRGDPYLWRALRDQLADMAVPASEGAGSDLLHAAVNEPVGGDLPPPPPPPVYCERYAHGGMSSGMISLDAWRQRFMPLLTERARTTP